MHLEHSFDFHISDWSLPSRRWVCERESEKECVRERLERLQEGAMHLEHSFDSHSVTLTLWLSLTHTHVLALSHTHFLSWQVKKDSGEADALSHTLSLSHSLFLPLSLPHTHTLSFSHSLSHAHALALSLTLSLKHTHCHALALSLSHTHSHTLSWQVKKDSGEVNDAKARYLERKKAREALR